jgi:Arc/MetJ-type ribon-helix-helix transcriptional regulator
MGPIGRSSQEGAIGDICRLYTRTHPFYAPFRIQTAYGAVVETEKVCVNLPAAELGKIDVLVAEGLYASRTDLIRAGIRTVLEANPEPVERAVVSGGARVGYQLLLRSEVEEWRAAGRKVDLFVVGVLRIQNGVSPELADATIARIRIFGSLRGPADVLARLEDRVVHGLEELLGE